MFAPSLFRPPIRRSWIPVPVCPRRVSETRELGSLSGMRLRLSPHPSQPAPVAAAGVDASRSGGCLTLTWRVTGAGGLRISPASAPARADGLWRTTCFELFLKPGAGEAYYEFNFSPSSEWAAYRFDGYRRGMANAAVAAPAIKTSLSGRTFTLSAVIDLRPLAVTPSARLGLSAVLETTDGAKSYWALAHTRDKPDFHRADGFIARLPFESRP